MGYVLVVPWLEEGMMTPLTRSSIWDKRRTAAEHASRGRGAISLTDELIELDRLEAQERERRCLGCGLMFQSSGLGNRMCEPCKATR